MWPIIAAAAGLILLTGAAKGAKNIQVNPQGAAARLVGGIPTIIIQFRIFNPGILAARINTIAGQVILGGNQVGSIEFSTATQIPPRATITVNVPIKLTIGVLPTLISFIRGELRGIVINANGTAFTSAGTINFNNSINLA